MTPKERIAQAINKRREELNNEIQNRKLFVERFGIENLKQLPFKIVSTGLYRFNLENGKVEFTDGIKVEESKHIATEKDLEAIEREIIFEIKKSSCLPPISPKNTVEKFD